MVLDRQIVILMNKTYFLMKDLFFNEDGEMVNGFVINGGYTLITKAKTIEWFIEVPDYMKAFNYNYVVEWAKRQTEDDDK